jgi:hypothetical protein
MWRPICCCVLIPSLSASVGTPAFQVRFIHYFVIHIYSLDGLELLRAQFSAGRLDVIDHDHIEAPWLI